MAQVIDRSSAHMTGPNSVRPWAWDDALGMAKQHIHLGVSVVFITAPFLESCRASNEDKFFDGLNMMMKWMDPTLLVYRHDGAVAVVRRPTPQSK